MGFNEGGFNGDGYGGFKRISLKKKKDLNPKISENISAAIDADIDFVEVFYTTKSASETVSAAITEVDVDFTEVFYTTESASETVSAAVTNLTVSLTSV